MAHFVTPFTKRFRGSPVEEKFTLKNGLQLLVKSGNVTKGTAGGVVVGEDEDFSGGSTVAQALLKAGGEDYKNCRDQLQRTIKEEDLFSLIFSCPAGDSLKYQYVLHAMVLLNGAMPKDWINHFKFLYVEMGKVAEEKKLSHLVTPLLGLGQAQRPLEMAVLAAIEGLSLLCPKVLQQVTIMEYDKKKAKSISKNVRKILTLQDTSTVPPQNGAHPPEGKMVEGKMVEGKMVEGKMVDGKMVKGKMVEGKMVEGKMVEGKMVEGKMVEGKMVDGKMVDGKMVEGKMVEGKMVEGKMVDGKMPNGKMVMSRKPMFCLEGFPDGGTILIEYSFPNGTQGPQHPSPGQPYKGTFRRAFLPDNQRGQRVLDLLEKAFKRKLTFHLVQTDQGWGVEFANIPHKTSLRGGPKGNGYPDPSYLSQVEAALTKHGLS